MDEKRVAYAGFETILDNLYAMKEALDGEKEAAKAKAIEEVELAFADKCDRIQKAIENASYVVEEPLAEEVVEEVVEETETAEAVEVAENQETEGSY